MDALSAFGRVPESPVRKSGIPKGNIVEISCLDGVLKNSYNIHIPRPEAFVKDWHDVCRAVCWTALFWSGAAYVSGQVPGSSERTGVPQDWSHRQIVFSRDGLALHPELMNREPRVLHQVMQRWGSRESGFFRGVDTGSDSSTGINRDWNVALGSGRLAPQKFPAKYSFNPAAPPDCTNDYVVFALNTQGATGAQANLIGINNLYSGTGGICGAAPTVYFAYDVTTVSLGKVATSPVLSLDGKKIAFVETSANAAVFHVLTWTANQGAIQNAAAPNMTSLMFATSGSTRSSPWVDYNADAAYVAADNGFVYKMTGVFKGTPALAGGFWPVQIGTAAFPLETPPVLDSSRGLLMVGNGNGNLYSINTTTGEVKSLAIGAFRKLESGVIAPPIVDITNGTTFVVSSNDGTSAVLVEVDTATLTELARARIGQGSASGTDVKLFQPALDDNYFNNPSTGKIRLCGTGAADATPWQYAFGFSGRLMNTTPVFSKQLLNSTTARCTGWTEFFNPNINGGTDYFFFGLLLDCGGGSTGCVVERISDTQLVTASVTNGPSGVVVDNYSTAAQASSIYLSNQLAPNKAYKFTQNGLQ